MTPKTEAELAQIIAASDGPLSVQAGKTRGLQPAGDPLDITGLNGVTLYEPGALTIVVEAGTKISDIDATLAREHQRLAFEPMDYRGLLATKGEPTIGGVIASNNSGPRRIQAGAARDFTLGVRFVDGAGNIIKNGGRVMKNVTGYDLVKLMCGSYGTLGVLTEVALKVLPIPETTGVVLINGLTINQAVSAMSGAMASPFEVSGAAHAPRGVDGHPITMLRVEGFEASVAYRCKSLQQLLAHFGESTVETDPARTVAGWKWVRDAELFHDSDGDVWRISCKPSDAPDLAARMEAKGILFDWAGGLIWALMPENTDLRARLKQFDGHATLVRASEKARAQMPFFQPEHPGVARLSAGLRARFDPRGILNPGLMGAR
ncbi:MAG: FAD-binding protein [Sulfitobacter sp.]